MLKLSTECLQSLASGAHNPRQIDENISEPARRTGEWFDTHPRYEAWAKCHRPDILWLVGKPGSGKSTLLLKLLKKSLQSTNTPSLQRMLTNTTYNEGPLHVEQLEHQSPIDENDGEGNNSVERKIVASYFYNFRNETEVSNQRMLQSVLYQILWQEPRIFPLFRKTHLRRRREGSVPWKFEDLTTIFRSIFEYQGFRLRIELFLDAVDESEHSSWIMDILRQQLTGRAGSDITVKAIVARRPMEFIHDIPLDQIIQMERHNAIDIEKLANEGVDKIQKALGNFTDKVDFIQHKCQEFRNKLKQRANGVILWVAVALTMVLNDSVRGNFTVDSMMKTLDALPSDLVELYTHIVYRLE